MRGVIIGFVFAVALPAQIFVGAMGGISTLSADAEVAGSPPAQVSAYKPENGPTFQLFGGRHFTDYFSAQVSYAWDRHSLLLTGADVAGQSSVDLPMRASVHFLGMEGMLYFRARRSRFRPYLAAGPGVSHITGRSTGPPVKRGMAALPDDRIKATRPALKVAVGIDIALTARLDFRYSFSETIQGNAIGKALRPPSQRNLANFQNWWGVAFRF